MGGPLEIKHMDERAVITLNQARCLKCKDVITSWNRHDFKWCRCGAIAVDGGTDYLRRLGSFSDVKDMSEYK